MKRRWTKVTKEIKNSLSTDDFTTFNLNCVKYTYITPRILSILHLNMRDEPVERFVHICKPKKFSFYKNYDIVGYNSKPLSFIYTNDIHSKLECICNYKFTKEEYNFISIRNKLNKL